MTKIPSLKNTEDYIYRIALEKRPAPYDLRNPELLVFKEYIESVGSLHSMDVTIARDGKAACDIEFCSFEHVKKTNMICIEVAFCDQQHNETILLAIILRYLQDDDYWSINRWIYFAMSKIIFLDIDGPMIPSALTLIDNMASWKRRFPGTTIAAINEICTQTGAKIVFNSTHSLPLENVPDIEHAIVAHGLDKNHLHPTDLKTQYPATLDRRKAIGDWLRRHPETTRWVALDDEPFTKERNLVLVDANRGLTQTHLQRAVSLLRSKTKDPM